MKKILLLFFIPFILYSQIIRESQVSLTNEYSVDVPHLAITGSTVHLIYGTNFEYYRFNIYGPQAPIETPPRPTDAWPVTVDIAADKWDTTHIVIVYDDFKYDYNTGSSFYGCFGIQSFDGGDTWTDPVLLDTVVLGSTYDNIAYNIPSVDFDDHGNFYALWKVHENNIVSNAVFLSKNFGTAIRIDNPDNDGFISALALTVSYDGNIGISYARTENGSVKFYLVSSTDGDNFTEETLIKDEGATFVSGDDFTKAFLFDDETGYYIYTTFDEAPSMLLKQPSSDTWDYIGVIDNDNYNYIAFYCDGDLGKLRYDDNTSSIKLWAYDAINNTWVGDYSVTDENAQINYAGAFLDADYTPEYVATAWRDFRTGNEEIFYSLSSKPLFPRVDQEPGIPNEFVLQQNYPNPFNPTTKIKYSIPTAQFVTLTVYNELGQEVAVLVSEYQHQGNYSTDFDASNLASGIYFYTLRAGNFVASKKMMLIK